MSSQEVINYRQKYAMPLPENRIAGIDYEELYRKVSVKEPFNAEEKMAYKNMKKREDYYKSIDIVHVFKKLDGQWRAKDKFRLESGNVIYTDIQTWKYVSGGNSDKKGRFGLSLVGMELGLNDFQVIDWYTEQFGIEYSEDLTVKEEFMGDNSYHSGKNKILFSPPTRDDENWGSVYRYLNEKRNIPSFLLNSLFDQGKLYADYESRCIFLSNASAEIRATPASSNPDFKGCTQGGQADVSGFSIMPQYNANESTIAIIESAIDAVSYNTLFPGRYAFSSNGSGRFGLHYKIALEALANGFKLSIGTDADEAGDIAAQKIFNALLVRQLIYNKYNKENNLKYKEIDKAIIEGKINIIVENSPHYLYFNDKDIKNKYSVFEREENELGKMVYVDKGNISDKCFSYSIEAGLFDFLPEGEKKEYPISTEQVNQIMNTYKIKRDRPQKTKDWNEELILLGTKYLNDYQKCAEEGFKNLPKLPDYLEVMKGEVLPIKFDEKGKAIVVKKEEAHLYNDDPDTKTEKENQARIDKKIQKSNNINTQNKPIEKENNTIKEKSNDNGEKNKKFTANYSRQELFNIIYLRYFLHQSQKIDFEILDQRFKENDFQFRINRKQPFLNFIDNKWEDSIAYVPKEQEEGNKVFYPPTIRYFDKKENEMKTLKVSKPAFMHIVKIMDRISDTIINSEDQKEELQRIGFNCFIDAEEKGLPLTVLLGKGGLFKKHSEEKNENRNKMKI